MKTCPIAYLHSPATILPPTCLSPTCQEENCSWWDADKAGCFVRQLPEAICLGGLGTREILVDIYTRLLGMDV